jgi:hypothetical protein
MISLDLTPPWETSSGKVYRNHPEGYRLAPTPFILGQVAQQHDLVDELTTILTHFVTVGTTQHWVMTGLQADKIGMKQDFTEGDEENEPEPLGDPRPVLSLSMTFHAREDHPDYAQIAGPRYDTVSTESLPEAVRDALLELYRSLTQ